MTILVMILMMGMKMRMMLLGNAAAVAGGFSYLTPFRLVQNIKSAASGCECFFTVRWMDAKTLAARPKALANLCGLPARQRSQN